MAAFQEDAGEVPLQFCDLPTKLSVRLRGVGQPIY
jgi:hypothetical protein